MIDRSIRPLFNSYSNEIQIVCNLLSFNGQDNPDVLCINTVSYALSNSNVDWNGSIGCVRVGLVDDKFVTNPSRRLLEKSSINLVLTVTSEGNIIMIESWADNVNQSKMEEAIKFGYDKALKIAQTIKNSAANNAKSTQETTTADKSVNNSGNVFEIFNFQTTSAIESQQLQQSKKSDRLNEEINKFQEAFQKNSFASIYDILTNYSHDKKSRDEAITASRNAFVNLMLKSEDAKNADPSLKAEFYNYQTLSEQFSKLVRNLFRDLIIDENKRCDGRNLDDLRPISCKSNLYEALHGSGLFQRGQTQVLCSLTFDSADSMYKANSISSMMSPSLTNFNKNFMLHYEFPSYAVNEISRIGGRADRREIGHGALAEKAVYPIIPNDYPFTIRAQCEVLESNGSSSMASVCATSLALMDAGVPIKEHVCGVAMGIITKFKENDKNKTLESYKILTDILGIEDYMGDMDFKVAGTSESITAIQADFKIAGLPLPIILEILKKSKDARAKIINLMNKEIFKAREAKKSNHPIMKAIDVPIAQRARLVGIGGVNLRRIQTRTDVQISQIDETKFSLFAPNKTALEEAEEMIKKYLDKPREPELEFGGIYAAKVVEIVPSGLMVQLFPTMPPALLPNSQLDGRKITHGSVSDFKVGQEIQVKYFGRDPADGKMRLSRKAIFKTNLPARDLFNLK